MHSGEVNISPVGQTVIFAAGQTQAQINVSVVDDGVPEETEEVQFQLNGTSGKCNLMLKRALAKYVI